MKHKQLRVVQTQPLQAAIHLRRHRLVREIDLVDDEHPVAPSAQRRADNRFAVAVFVPRCRIDHIEPVVHRRVQRGDTCFQRHVAVG